jgi:hypothetical protein
MLLGEETVNRREFFKRNALAGMALGMNGYAFGKQTNASPKPSPLDPPTLVPEHFSEGGFGRGGPALEGWFC